MGRLRKKPWGHTYRELSVLKEAAVYTEFIAAYTRDHQDWLTKGLPHRGFGARSQRGLRIEDRGSRVVDREASFEDF